MAEAKQYLRVHIGEAVFLLPDAGGCVVSRRENLDTADAAAPVVAWRTAGDGRLPAYALDGALKPAPRDDWRCAVFIESAPGGGAGFVADDAQPLAGEEVTVASFEPLGAPPTPAGHVFDGARLSDARVVLVFEPRALVAYLQSLGGT
jgi:hypothetical protein